MRWEESPPCKLKPCGRRCPVKGQLFPLIPRQRSRPPHPISLFFWLYAGARIRWPRRRTDEEEYLHVLAYIDRWQADLRAELLRERRRPDPLSGASAHIESAQLPVIRWPDGTVQTGTAADLRKLDTRFIMPQCDSDAKGSG